MDIFRLWVGACSHVHSDLKHGRRSLAEAIRQSESGGFEGRPERLSSQGAEPLESSPAEAARYLAAEIDKRGKVVKTGGIKLE